MTACEKCGHEQVDHYSDGACFTEGCPCERNHLGEFKLCSDCGREFGSGWGSRCSPCYWGPRCEAPGCFEKPGHAGPHKDLFGRALGK